MERFKDLNWFKKAHNKAVTIIGNGGIGSWTSIFIARAGFTPVIIDHDTVDNTNISGQMFFKSQVYMSKVEATKEIIEDFGGQVSKIYNRKFLRDSHDFLSLITIVGTDNMTSRKDAWLAWKKKYIVDNKFPEEGIFIDARLLAESFQIFCITNLEDSKTYETNYLYKENEVQEISCSAKQTSHYAGGIAFNITRFVTNFLSSLNGTPTYVPFIYELNGIFSDDTKFLEVPKKEEESKQMELIT